MRNSPTHTQLSQSAPRLTLFIDSIHNKLTKTKVISALERYGNIDYVDLPKTKKGKKKVLIGYGLIQARDKFSFNNLLTQEIYLKGKRLHIEAFNFESDTLEEKHQSYLNRLIFVSNVPKKMTPEDLHTLCTENFGAVYSASKSVTATGRIKPFGFIVFQEEKSALACAKIEILVGDSYALSFRLFDEEKPDESIKDQDKEKREEAKDLKKKNSDSEENSKRKSSSGNSSHGIEEHDLRAHVSGINQNTQQDRQGGSPNIEDNSPLSLERGEEGEEEKVNPSHTHGNTQSTFPPSRVASQYPYSRLRAYESDISYEFQRFCREMQEAVHFYNQHYPFNMYEQYYHFSNLYPAFGFEDPSLSQNGDTNEDSNDDIKTHLRRRIIRKVRKNHGLDNVRFNKASRGNYYNEPKTMNKFYY